MRVIDLLNKIVNGEEVPKKIAIQNDVLIYNEKYKILYLQDYYYMNDVKDETWKIWAYSLNDEVEILDNEDEEKKIPEKLDMVLLGQCDNWTQKYNKDTKEMENTHIELNPYVIDTIRENTLEIQHKFNEIIDYLKSKGE